MFGSNILEVAIGLVFIFLLYSLLATSINEAIATYFGWRAKNLKKAISRMLDDDSGKTVLSERFYQEPLIKYLGEQTFFGKIQRKPAYLSAQNFSKNVMDLLKDLHTNPDEEELLEKIKGGIDNIPAAETKKFIRSLMEDAGHDMDKFKLALEQWYNDTMERASGWYKRKVQYMIFVIGLCLSVAFNVDSIQIVQNLSKDPEATRLLVNMAGDYIQKQNNNVSEAGMAAGSEKDTTAAAGTISSEAAETDSLLARHDSIVGYAEDLLKGDIEKANNLFSAGWGNYGNAPDRWGKMTYVLSQICIPRKLIGFLITTFAISLGAPFWFDLLSKLISIRASGKKPKEQEK